ncbi:hypothetical protein Harman_41700 [Haloarcula mannanilytica]|uniref:Uncharacterized protein n=1 Tax=Haloarcula mannanilytica TaxID=2509225 RepID=A0A4C2EPI5_9EURY|nr:hypothetical protein [Haloarcula mannanilytica]GCF16235.1 hypothetical protein Harman_41700 [Haloarcula mannanilytica]
MRLKTCLTAACLIMVLSTVLAGAAAADQAATPSGKDTGDGEEGDGRSVEELVESIASALLIPLQRLANELSGLLTRVFASYPEVTSQEVLDIHEKVFRVSLVLSGAAVVWIGVLRLANIIDAIRPLASVIGAVGLGSVAPELLRYPVEISRLTTEALMPQSPGFLAVTRFTLELALVAFFDSTLLLGIALIFLGRDVFLMAGVALSPLIGLMIATPRLRTFGERLVNLWIACLLIGPLNAVVYDLTLTLLESGDLIPHFLWALAGIGLMFGLPLVLLGAGVTMALPLTRVAGQATGIVYQQTLRVADEKLNIDVDRGSQQKNKDSRNRRNRFTRRGDD